MAWLDRDLKTKQSVAVAGLDFHSGAYYLFRADNRPLVSLSAADYSSTTWYDLSDLTRPTAALKMRGWGIRLFKVR